MKFRILFSTIILLIMNFTAYAQDTTVLRGKGDRTMLEKLPYSEWLKTGYDSYKPDPKVMEKCAQNLIAGTTFTVVMGTWCPDSRREVPKFLKVLDVLQIPSKDINFLFVDRSKSDDSGDSKKMNISLVPTFIVFNNENKEIGRVTEGPVKSLEKDLLGILK